MLFERARIDLQDRYLSIHESLSILSSQAPVVVEVEILASFHGNALQDTSFTEIILRLKKKLAVIITVKERSSNIFFTGQYTTLFMNPPTILDRGQ